MRGWLWIHSMEPWVVYNYTLNTYKGCLMMLCTWKLSKNSTTFSFLTSNCDAMSYSEALRKLAPDLFLCENLEHWPFYLKFTLFMYSSALEYRIYTHSWNSFESSTSETDDERFDVINVNYHHYIFLCLYVRQDKRFMTSCPYKKIYRHSSNFLNTLDYC